MDHYRERLIRHLAAYAKNQLGVTAPGIRRGKSYDHILPSALSDINILAQCRTDFLSHLKAHPEIKLHQDFRHLNSSQAFAFNLFLPFFLRGVPQAQGFFSAFSTIMPNLWWFELVPDPAEGTNVDVSWKDERGGSVYCEVKLSEAEFGTAKDDAKHRDKLERIYRDRLAPLVPDEYLEPSAFFANYQILRNISLLFRNPQDKVVFLLPQENEGLSRQLDPVIQSLEPAVRARIRVVYIEQLLHALVSDSSLPTDLRAHAAFVVEKYLP